MIGSLAACDTDTHGDSTDIESLYSMDDSSGGTTILALQITDDDLSDDTPSDISDDGEDEIFLCSNPSPTDSISLLQPMAKITLLLGKYEKPISVIALFDIGAAASIINPAILPRSHWESCSRHFYVTNGELFLVTMISKPITIQLFPGYSIKHQCYGTDLLGKDLLIGFDILKTLPQINWMPKGLRFKHHFLPWTSRPNLFLLDTFVPIL